MTWKNVKQVTVLVLNWAARVTRADNSKQPIHIGRLFPVDVTINGPPFLHITVSQTHCRPRPELDIDLIPAHLSPGNSEAGARPVG